MKDETLRNAFQNLEELSMTHEQYLAYESRSKQIMDEEAAQREMELRIKEIEEKEHRLEEAENRVKEAIQEGRKEGREEGEIKGIEKAMETIGRRLLEKGKEIDFVAETTGLAKEEVLEINENMKN